MDSNHARGDGSMSGPFPALQGLSAYPKPEAFRYALMLAKPKDRRALVYLWLTEGCPFGMEPRIYQWFRAKVAKVAGIECKAVSLTGSYRLGYSLKPNQFGVGVKPTSDIDGLIVSSQLFDRVLSVAREVARKHRSELVPEVERCAKQNFVRTDYIVPRKRSSLVQSMHDCYLFLSNAPFNLEFDHQHSCFFVYRDWDSAIRKNMWFLEKLKKGLAKQENPTGGKS